MLILEVEHTALFTVPDSEVRATPRENDEWYRIQAIKDPLRIRGWHRELCLAIQVD